MRNTILPSAVAWALMLSYGVLFLVSIFFQSPVTLVEYFRQGLDLSDFIYAARDVLAHVIPYGRERFVTPPLSAYLAVPLVGLDGLTAARIFFFFNILFVFIAVYAMQRSCDLGRSQRLWLMTLPLLSAPTIMLIERGNIDGVVALCLVGILAAWKWRAVAGILLGVGISLKAYPAILLLPLGLARNFRALTGAFLVLVATIFFFDALFLQFIANQIHRAASVRAAENLSAFVLLLPVRAITGISDGAIAGVYFSVLAALLAYCLVADARTWRRIDSEQKKRALLASYLIFAINIPTLVYLYTGIVVIILLTVMSDQRLDLSCGVTWRLFFGCSLCLFPARSFDLTLRAQNAHELTALCFNLLPPLGSMILLFVFFALRREGAGERSSLITEPAS